MSDEDYRDMVVMHDKHIDKLALSIEHIAGAVGSTNRKLEDIIDVISKQNLLMEKFSNLESNSKEAFSRIRDEFKEIEDTHKNTGCSFVIGVERRVGKLETTISRVMWIVITAVIGSIMSLVLIKGN